MPDIDPDQRRPRAGLRGRARLRARPATIVLQDGGALTTTSAQFVTPRERGVLRAGPRPLPRATTAEPSKARNRR